MLLNLNKQHNVQFCSDIFHNFSRLTKSQKLLWLDIIGSCYNCRQQKVQPFLNKLFQIKFKSFHIWLRYIIKARCFCMLIDVDLD